MDHGIANLGLDPVAMHHDVLIEIGRVDMALEIVSQRAGAEPEIAKLCARRAKLEAVLGRLPS